MGKKIVINESERNHIKGLYEQKSNSKQLEIGDLAFTSIQTYKVTVGVKGDYDDNPVDVEIRIDGRGGVVEAFVDGESYSESVTDQEAVNFVTEMAKRGYFKNLPTYMSYDIQKNEPFDFN
jgi:hypothetical protein